MNNILVMGGSQFVSEALAKYLITKGYSVDIFTRGHREIQYKGIRRHMKGDRNNIDDLKSNLIKEKYDFVYDISAYTMKQVEMLKPFIQTNQLKRYIFFSSGGVYLPSNNSFVEDSTRGKHPLLGDYGINKKEAEDYLFQIHKQEDFPMTIFRPPYIYGEGNNLYREAYLFDRIQQNQPIPIPDNEVEVHFIHITDVVKVLESVMFNEKSNGEAFNLAYPENVTWEYLVKTAGRVTNRVAKMVAIDDNKLDNVIQTRHYFPYLNLMYKLDTKKLETLGLYKPKIDLESGMKQAFYYYTNGTKVQPNPFMDKVDEVVERMK